MADDSGAAEIQAPDDTRPTGGSARGRRRGRRGHLEHGTIDLTGARRGYVDTQEPGQLGDASAVYSTGSGNVQAYHYDRRDAYEQLYATREDMQLRNPERQPEVRGPGQ